MNRFWGRLATALVVLAVLGCDSPPWSRFIVANSSQSDITVRFYMPYISSIMALPYVYSPEEWAADKHFTSGTPKDSFKINEEQNYMEVILTPGAAVEIYRGAYPEVEEDVESNFLIDRLDIYGPSGDFSWVGRRGF